MAALTALFLALSCLGWGELVLRAARLRLTMAAAERASWALVLGFGVLGWLFFLPPLVGHVEPLAFLLILAPGMAGLRPVPTASPSPSGPVLGLGLVLTAVLLVQVAVGLAPPSDADSLAYHFAIPRQMLISGGLVFVPRAADGAVPLLQQMHSLAALSLGGEGAMTLWAALSGLMAAPLLYSQARHWLGRTEALALVLVVITTPAFLYGSGAGQVETRLGGFILAALLALGRARDRDSMPWLAVAGLCAGFAMASKYPGLLIVAACGLMVLIRHRSIAPAALFGAVALVAGGQWYGWNWFNTGDPFFPMLFGLVPYGPDVPWNAAQADAFKAWSRLVETPLAHSFATMLAYPWIATFSTSVDLENGRTGLGIFPIMILPFALWGAARRVRTLPAHLLWDGVMVAVIFYGLWFWFGASQRVRHYLPLLPFVVLALGVAAQSVAARLRGALVLAVLLALGVQMAGLALFARGFVHRLTSGESRDQYLARTVSWYPVVQWTNANLDAGAKVMIVVRQWTYLLERPVLFANAQQQAQVEIRDNSTDGSLYWRQLRRAKISHVVTTSMIRDWSSQGRGGFYGLTAQLLDAGCAVITHRMAVPAPVDSRTFGSSGGGSPDAEGMVIALTPDTCRLE